MKLGNTNRGNTGKKYLLRSSVIDKAFGESEAERTSCFNTWFVNNIHSLKQEWINKGQFKDDVFTDTYIRICESIAFGDPSIKSFENYFSRAYYTNYILNKKYENRFQDIDLSLLDQEEKGCIHAFEFEYEEIISIMFSKVDNLFSDEESIIFKEFMLWKENQQGKHGASCYDFAKATNKKPHIVQKIFRKVKKTLKEDKDLDQKISSLYSLL